MNDVIEDICHPIETAHFPGGFSHFRFGEVGSTNALAKQISVRDDVLNFWISAESQSAGRGSRARDWSSPPGNLYASVMFGVKTKPMVAATLTFVAALALRNALIQFVVDGNNIKLKWPNDILLNGSKLSGILLEFEQVSPCEGTAIIGFGVNCLSHPEKTNYPATCLKMHGVEITPNNLLEILHDQFLVLMEVWDCGRGFDKIRNEWLKHAAGIGTSVTIEMPGATKQGIFEGIDENGSMILDIGEKKAQKISVGDVFFN